MAYKIAYNDATHLFRIVGGQGDDEIEEQYDSWSKADDRIKRILAVKNKPRKRTASIPVITNRNTRHIAKSVHLGTGMVTLDPPVGTAFGPGVIYADTPKTRELVEEYNQLDKRLDAIDMELKSFTLKLRVGGYNATPEQVAQGWDEWINEATALIDGPAKSTESTT